MPDLGNMNCFRSLEAGAVSLDVPVVNGVVQTYYAGPASRVKYERLAVDIHREPAAQSPDSISMAREDGEKLQVCSHYEVVEGKACTRTSLTLFDKPIPELTFVRSPAGIWATQEAVTTDKNKNHLVGFAGLIGLSALNKQNIQRLTK